MRPEFEFNYDRSLNARGGKSLTEKMRLMNCIFGNNGSDVEVIVIDPEEMRSGLEIMLPYRETIVEAIRKERKENAE